MTVYAGGALCWRMFLGEPHVLVVHRRRHKDLSFPKGKVEAGEILPVTAVREVHEETGLAITLGAHLGVVSYRLPNGADKVVHYWESHVSESAVLEAIASFAPNDEVSELHWLSFQEARRKLSYEHDLEPLNRLEEHLRHDLRHAFPIIVLRHGKALARASWGKSEATRPLTTRGTAQAKALVAGLSPWHPRTLLSSTWERCLRTISPYAHATSTPVATRDKLTEDASNTEPAKTQALVAHHAAKGRSVLFCTHRPVLPHVADAIGQLLENPAELDHEMIEGLDTGAFVVVTVSPSTVPGRYVLHGQEMYAPLDA